MNTRKHQSLFTALLQSGQQDEGSPVGVDKEPGRIPIGHAADSVMHSVVKRIEWIGIGQFFSQRARQPLGMPVAGNRY